MDKVGIGASAGIIIGKMFVYNSDLDLKIEKQIVKSSDLELSRFSDAIEKSKVDIKKIRQTTANNLGEEKAQIFDAHELLLSDPELISQVESIIKNDKVNAEWAVENVTNTFIDIFRSMDDEYMKERASDIDDVFTRVKKHLLNINITDLSQLDEEVVIVTHDLTPSETATMNKNAVLGVLTNIGNKTSHSAIMARTMEIPAVVGLSDISNIAKNGDTVILDGTTGRVILHPNKELIKEYTELKQREDFEKEELRELVGVKTVTKDGVRIEVAGNIGQLQDLDSLERNDAEAVGLYRTEFLFMDRSNVPSEDEQLEAYTKVVEHLNGKNCIFRTLDIGGDKQLSYLNIGNEENPFLGYRAIRICLKDHKLFKTQLRAILRAGIGRSIGIMFPMISSVDELLEAKSILEDCKIELSSEGHTLGEVKVGMMIEIPSSAVMSDIFAKYVDFFSIGTNDLTQYTCAVDRMNEKIGHLYDSFNPGLLRMINMTAKSAKANGVMLAMCGSMAHEKLLVPLFVGMGFDELSMSPMHILSTRKQIMDLSQEDCRPIVEEVMKLETSTQIKEYLGSILN